MSKSPGEHTLKPSEFQESVMTHLETGDSDLDRDKARSDSREEEARVLTALIGCMMVADDSSLVSRRPAHQEKSPACAGV